MIKIKALSIIEVGVFKNWGGKEQHIIEMSHGLQNAGHKVLLVTRKAAIDKMPANIEIKVLPLRGAADLYSIISLAYLIRQHQADIIHVHNGRETWIAVLAVVLAGQGHVVVTRHAVLTQKKAWYYAWLARRISKTICVSHLTKETFLAGGSYFLPENVEVVHNGIDFGRFMDKKKCNRILWRQQHALQIKDKVVGFIGKYDSSKGISVLIKAMAKVVVEYPDAKAVLVGTTQIGMEWYLEELKNLIHDLHLDKNVLLIGFTADIPAVIAAIDIFTLPSLTPESFGLVLLEAMAGGKPVITTNNGAQTEFIKDSENGLLVQPNSVDELANAILQLVVDSDKAVRLGLAGQNLVSKCFSLEKMVQETVVVFNSCLL